MLSYKYGAFHIALLLLAILVEEIATHSTVDPNKIVCFYAYDEVKLSDREGKTYYESPIYEKDFSTRQKDKRFLSISGDAEDVEVRLGLVISMGLSISMGPSINDIRQNLPFFNPSSPLSAIVRKRLLLPSSDDLSLKSFCP